MAHTSLLRPVSNSVSRTLTVSPESFLHKPTIATLCPRQSIFSTEERRHRLTKHSSRSVHSSTQDLKHNTDRNSITSFLRHPKKPVFYTNPKTTTRTHNFSTTPYRQRDHHFDTLKFVQRLENEGLTEEQAKSLMRVLSDVIEESIQNLTRTMVPREDALKTSYTQKVDFAALRTELLNVDSNESTTTKSSHERLTNELQKLNNRLRDEIQRTQASVRLDLNLEKGRIREESNVQELKIKETENRIEQEVAGLRERVEAVKFSTLQWLMGVATGTAALLLGAWRLLM